MAVVVVGVVVVAERTFNFTMNLTMAGVIAGARQAPSPPTLS